MKKILILLLLSIAVQAEDKVEFPSDYQSTFTEYLSLDRIQNHDQFIKLYANDKAMMSGDNKEGLHSGSVIVAEIYSVKKTADGEVIKSALNRRIKDQLKLVAIMEKKAHYAQQVKSAFDVGDWAFAAYKPNGEKADKDIEACRACHAPLKQSDYLFSKAHLVFAK